MNRSIKSTLLASIAVLLFAGATTAPPCLCNTNEVTIYSFSTAKSKKIASVCAEKNQKYLVYRYGLSNKVELTFPAVLDKTSWKKFTYEGYVRGGGPMNAAMNNQSLSFTNQDATYEIYHYSGYADTTEESFSQDAGIIVTIKGKRFDSKANPSSISGSLQSLDQYETIENNFGQ